MTETTVKKRPRGRPRSGPDPERFKEIVEAAATVFLRSGYDGASIQDIAAEVGILKGSLYYYVKTKEDFLFEIIRGVFERALLDMETVAQSTAPAIDRLREYIRVNVEFAIKNQTHMAIRMREFSRLSADRAELITKEGDAYTAILRQILEDGIKEGSMRADMDVRITGHGILGMLNYTTSWYNPEGSLTPSDVVAGYTPLILQGVSTAHAPE